MTFLGKDGELKETDNETGNDVLHRKISPPSDIDRAAMSDALLPEMLSAVGLDLNPAAIVQMVAVLDRAGFSREDAFAGVQDIVHEVLNLCVAKAKAAMDSHNE